MNNKDYIEVRVDVKDAEIVEKLDILRLERGISNNSFIIASIAEKLKREGYLQEGVKPHKKVERKKSDIDDLIGSLRKIDMRRR